jgi:translation elongation factor aEF-1 beta
MGSVIGLIRVMPSEVVSDEVLQKMIDDIKTVIKELAKIGRIDVKNVAFGLRGLDVTVEVPDDAGGLDPIVEEILKVENVDNAEVTDVGRI